MKLPGPSWMPRLSRRQIPLATTTAIAWLLYLLAGLKFREQHWFSGSLILNLFVDNGVLGIVAVGMTFVILSGGIDLSVGSTVAFTGVYSAKLLAHGVPPAVVIVSALVIGTALGATQGWLVQSFELPPFLVTLAGMFLMRGLALVVSTAQIPIENHWYQHVAAWSVKPSAVAFLAVFLVALYVAHFTPFGRNVYALGGNEQSGLLMGLPMARTKVGVYALSGFCAALAGVTATFYFLSGDSTHASGMELDAIAAVVIGGTLLTGGVGYVAGTLVGVVILGLILDIVGFANINSWWTRIGIGLLLLTFILLQRGMQRRAER
jgi:simple sugar transport system permease protein